MCLAAVEGAIARYGSPAVRNADHGSQFISAAFTGCLLQHGIQISMDGRGCWRDNVFVVMTLALPQVRRGLPARLRLRLARDDPDRPLPHLLQNSRRPHSQLSDHPPTTPAAPPSHCLALPNHSPVASRYLPRLRLYRATGPLLPRDRSMATALRRESRSPLGRWWACAASMSREWC